MLQSRRERLLKSLNPSSLFFVCLFCFLEKSSGSYGWVGGNKKEEQEERALIFWRIIEAASWSTQTWVQGRAEEAGLGLGGYGASMGCGVTLAWVSYRSLHLLSSVTLDKFFILRLRILICKMKLMTEVIGLLRRFNEMIYVKCTAQGLPQSDDHTDVSFSTSTSMNST